MSSINVTVTYDPLAADLYATDRAPYTVSGWFIDPVSDVLVSGTVHGTDCVQLLKELMTDLCIKCDDAANLAAPDFEVEVETITDEEYVK